MNSKLKPRWFRCLIGSKALAALTQSQSDPETFTLLLAASGGPRWLGLVGADRALKSYLAQRRTPLPTLGASSGAWRLAAMAADQSGEAYQELIHEYIEQRYEGKPTPEEVSEVCRDYLARLFTPGRIESALNNATFQLNFTTALSAKERPSKVHTMVSLFKACLLNAVDRRLLGRSYQRAIFSRFPHPDGSPLSQAWDAIPSISVALSPQNFLPGLLATGSIPTVLSGVSAIVGSAPGHHFDGGLVDYHFEIEATGPVLYPHFSSDPVPGWLDRFPPYRKIRQEARSQLCIVMPTDEMVARYAAHTYPSRDHFKFFSNDERIRMWQSTVKENQLLEKELNLCLESGDLARISEPL